MGGGFDNGALRAPPGNRNRYGRTIGITLVGGALAMFLVNQAPAAAFAEPGHDSEASIDLLPPISAAVATTPEPVGEGFELTLRWPDDDRLTRLLVDAGAAKASAEAAATLIDRHFAGNVPTDSDLKIVLGFGPAGSRTVRKIAVLNDLGEAIFDDTGGKLRSSPAADSLRRSTVALDGQAYWTLRQRGLSGAPAKAILERIGSQGKGGELVLVTGQRPNRFDAHRSARLLYFAERRGGATREWIRWDNAPDGWLAVANAGSIQTGELMQPTEGRMTSSYGIRVHPILGFARFHRGVDFAAKWGSPIRAAADGQISSAGWRGGYGRQVRIEHAEALSTTYSHLAQTLVQSGERVRKGQLVGFAGASGLTTGPHLHFEVFRNGRSVDPSRVAVSPANAPLEDKLAAMLERIRRARPA